MRHPTRSFVLERVLTALGEMLVLTDEHARLRALDWTDCTPRFERLLKHHYGEGRVVQVEQTTRSPVRELLERYLAGELHALDSVVVETAGTPFQRSVWAALRAIPAGTTVSYGELAERVGRPSAVRAVGLANGSNPVGIVVPCHRVIGKNRSLTGYGGGLPRKHWLLQHEGVYVTPG